MFDVKKCFSAFLVVVCLFSSINVFAENEGVIFYDSGYNKNIVSDLPRDDTAIIIEGEKNSVKAGDTFFVDFRLKNNPGFASYGFSVEYDENMVEPISISSENCKVEYDYNSKVKNKCIESEIIKKAFENRSDGGFSITGICTSSLGKAVNTNGDGVLFTVEFKALKKGKSFINLSGVNDFILSDYKYRNLPVYVQGLSISIMENFRNMENETTESDKDYDENVARQEEITEKDNIEKENEDKKTANILINVPTNMSEAVQFRDLARYPRAKDSISFLSSLGIVKGIGWRTFKPEQYTSRADFMVIVKRFTGIEGSADVDFSDVDPRAYYAEAVGVISNYGLADGMTDTEFRPKENITKQEVCAVLARVLDAAGKLQKSDPNVLDKFIDGDFVSPYAREYVADLIGMGIVSGNDKNRLMPVEPITRAEVCVLVKKVYDLIK